jgi:ribosomal protein L11 methyltransferase
MMMTISTKTLPKKTRKNSISPHYTLTLHITAGLDMTQAGLFSDIYDEETALSSSFKKDKQGWDFLWTFDHKPDEQDARKRLNSVLVELQLPLETIDKFNIEELENRDWLAESYQALPPFVVGGFYIYGSHYTGPKPTNKIPLLIEAATAFGSGEHGTTSCCILAIEHVKQSGFKPRNILDMGCGSGILAAAVAKLWPDVQTYAADNDPECIRVTDLHLQSNDITNVKSYVSEGYDAASPVWKNAPYDFIIANILAGPLIEMAAEQSKALANAGYLILSGTLKEQAERVIAAYVAHGLILAGEFPGDEWMTILMRKA